MSLQWSLSREVPADTLELGQQLFRIGNPYRLLGDRFDQLLPEEEAFRGLYCATGRGAIPPLLVALVTVFQFLEKVPDRQAAELVVSRMDWKYALHLPLTYRGFHFTDLCAFRIRVLEHQAERQLFEQVLRKLQDLGLIKKRGKMRTDSTHVLAVVHRLTQLELVSESLRVALRASRGLAPAWVEQALPPAFCEAYAVRISEYGMSHEEGQEQLGQAGQDGYWFLEQVDRSAPEAVRGLAEVAVLRPVLEQQFPQGPGHPPAKRPKGTDVIETPHEVEARRGIKREQAWIGYKMQATETCDEDLPHLIVDLEATGALENDSPQLPHIQARLKAQDTLPREQHVDHAYISGAHLAQSASLGIDLLGLPPHDTKNAPGFRQDDFHLDPQQQQATCPAGQTRAVWSTKKMPRGEPPAILIRFAAKTCQACPFFGLCTTSPQGRSLTLNPYHDVLQARRAEAHTATFLHRLHLRAGIEGTISELVRSHGLRRCRYRDQAKLRLQGYFTALAVNLKRIARWLAAHPAPLSLSLSCC